MQMNYKIARLAVVLAAGLVLIPCGGAGAQTIGTSAGQNPTGFSIPVPVQPPSPSPFNREAVPLGSNGKPLPPSISTVPPLPGHPPTSSAKRNAALFPKEGEKNADGQTVHYEMMGHEVGTGYGALNGVPLPPRTFRNIDLHLGQ